MDITKRLRGHEIDMIMTNGNVLSIRLANGAEVNVRWIDHNGEVIKGLPVIETIGLRLNCSGFKELVTGASLGAN